MVPLSELRQAMEDPQFRHAAMVHFPVVLSVAAFGLALIAALFRSWSRIPLAIALLAFIALVVSARMAGVSGDAAEGAVGVIAEEARVALDRHKHLGRPIYLYAIVVTFVTFLGMFNKWKLGLIAPWLSVAGGGFLLLKMASAAHVGGTLVYEYGLGTPNPMTDKQLAIARGEYKEPTPAYDDPRVVYFHERVRPVLYMNCMGCHAASDPAADLDLTTIAGALAGGSRGPSLVPGSPEESLLMRSISWEDEDLFMPPEVELSDADKEVIRQWISDGAVWDYELPAPEEEEADGAPETDDAGE